MDEKENKFLLDDLSYDVLRSYVNYGYGDMKVYRSSFFMIYDDEIAVMTLQEYYDKATEARKEFNVNASEIGEWKDAFFDEELGGTWEAVCSLCKVTTYTKYGRVNYPFCPNCGKRMKQESENE